MAQHNIIITRCAENHQSYRATARIAHQVIQFFLQQYLVTFIGPQSWMKNIRAQPTFGSIKYPAYWIEFQGPQCSLQASNCNEQHQNVPLGKQLPPQVFSQSAANRDFFFNTVNKVLSKLVPLTIKKNPCHCAIQLQISASSFGLIKLSVTEKYHYQITNSKQR